MPIRRDSERNLEPGELKKKNNLENKSKRSKISIKTCSGIGWRRHCKCLGPLLYKIPGCSPHGPPFLSFLLCHSQPYSDWCGGDRSRKLTDDFAAPPGTQSGSGARMSQTLGHIDCLSRKDKTTALFFLFQPVSRWDYLCLLFSDY